MSKKKNIFDFSSPQQIDIYKLSSNINKNSDKSKSNKDLIKYIRNSRNNYLKSPTSKTSKSIKINKFHAKTFEIETEKKDKDNKEDLIEGKNTSKIDYRNYKSYPIKDVVPIQNFEDEEQQLYWLVTYDKLIKSKNIIKILNNNNYMGKNRFNSMPIYTESSLKIKTMKIPKFELFFVKGYDKPFVRPNNNKNSFILTKLYLLNKKEINKILNFINRIDDKINIDNYISVNKENLYYFINNKNNLYNNADLNYPYCYIYYLGKFMNISMYLFTNSFNYFKAFDMKNNILYSLPSSKKLYKLIKILIKSFPEYNPNDIINYIIKSELYSNSKEIKYEILNYLSLLRNSEPNKNLINKVIHDTITGILVNLSNSKSSIPLESGNQIKSSEKTKNEIKMLSLNQNSDKNKKAISVPNKFEFKSSLHSINNNICKNGGLYGTNFSSTNHTMLPSNSIRTFSNKNSTANNVPFITIPCDLKNRLRKTLGNYSLYNNKLIKGKMLIPKNNNNEIKKISVKNINNRYRNKLIKENKENIDINSILNKKKNDNISVKNQNNKDNKDNISNDGLNKNKQNDKNNKNEYHTPIKKKRLTYYK